MEIPRENVREIDQAHGPAENLAPFLAYLSTEEAAYINGAVFHVTGSGEVNLFSEPALLQQGLYKQGNPWTVAELSEAVPKVLLKDYVSCVVTDEFSTMKRDLP